MIKLNLKELADSKGLSRYELCKRINVTYPTIDKIYKNKTSSISFDTLDRLCSILECTPGDIIKYEPQSEIKGTIVEVTKNGIFYSSLKDETHKSKRLSSDKIIIDDDGIGYFYDQNGNITKKIKLNNPKQQKSKNA